MFARVLVFFLEFARRARCADDGQPAILFPEKLQPGPAECDAHAESGTLVLRNQVLEAAWAIRDGSLQGSGFLNRAAGETLKLHGDVFSLRVGELPGVHFRSGQLRTSQSGFQVTRLTGEAGARQPGAAAAGWRAEVELFPQAIYSLVNKSGACSSQVDNLGEVDSPEACADLVRVNSSCGSTFMFSHSYHNWGCRCCVAGDVGQFGNANWWRYQLNDFKVRWSAELRDGSGYLRLAAEIVAHSAAPVVLQEVVLFDGPLPYCQQAGSVEGVPVVASHFFVGLEHPQSKNIAEGGGLARCSLSQTREIKAEASHQTSLVLGAAPPGQIRRSFLHYLERERAHPTRAMLHYNSWYDLGTGRTFNASDALKRLDHIAKELGARGVTLDAFLLDDGWDDPDSGPYAPHVGFSGTELKALEDRAAEWGTGLGVWFSPFGGYHEPRQRRVAAARAAVIPVREETRDRKAAVFKGHLACTEGKPCKEGEGSCTANAHCEGGLECWNSMTGLGPPGVDVSGIKQHTSNVCFDPGAQSAFLGLGLSEYYSHLRAKVEEWLRGGARMLKLDGIGNPSGLKNTLVEDFDAAVAFIADLRRVSRHVFINLSTGTWPSPFWLLSSDTVWRRGHDHYFAGEGPARERWITYRDSMVYEHVVRVSPLFPLNSLMVHGVIFAKDAWDLKKPEGDGEGTSDEPFRNEVRSAFGCGVMLQELYVTPSLLSSQNWDDLASAARWARPCMATLADVHWVGGDPSKGEAYGWAAWRDSGLDGWEASAVLTLRNPSLEPRVLSLDAAKIFELPQHALGRVLELNTPFPDQRLKQIRLRPGTEEQLNIPPLTVLVFDLAAPRPQVLTVLADTIRDHGPKVFWSLVVGLALWAWRRSHAGTGSSSAAPAVSAEELRRKRLQALGQHAADSAAAAESMEEIRRKRLQALEQRVAASAIGEG